MRIVNLMYTLVELTKNRLSFWKNKQNIQEDAAIQVIMENVHKNGFHVISEYFDADTCTRLKKEIDGVFASHEKSLWKDEHGSDTRAFGVDRVSSIIKDTYYNDPLIVSAREHYYQLKDEHIIGVTLANKVVAVENNLGSGGGWHRDTVNKRQFKAIMYLNDVGEENGAFQYVSGTQFKKSVVNGIVKNGLRHNHNRFSEEEISALLKNEELEVCTLTGKAGSLILVDTSGIHRGSPIQQGERYALTNYYWLDEAKGGRPIPENIKSKILKAPEASI